MGKIYQPIVVEKANLFIESLEESNFFIDYELESKDFAKEYLCDRITEKFIKGEIEQDSNEMFTEEEIETYLKEIIAGTLLNELKNKGLVNSYDDDNTDETFFLTDEGKEYLKKMIEEDKED
jgi:hypothetical protein